MRKKRVGIIGCGNIFPMHAASVQLSGAAEVVAVCDVIEERAKTAAQAYNCDYYLDYNRMLEEAKLDVVHVCTPHYLHAPMVIAAARAGKHVITEKPMSITVEDAEAMIQACEDHNVTFGVIFQNRYNPGSLLIKKELESGRLGQVLGARCSVTWKRTDEYYSQDDWRGTWEQEGGGVIINQSIHTLDLMRWFVDDELDFVSANISNRTHEHIEVEDCAEGIISFKNGVAASFYTMTYHSCDAPVEIELHCENGYARVYGDRGTVEYHNGTTLSADKDPNETMDYGAGVKQYWGISHSKQIKDFYHSIDTGKKAAIDGYEAIKTQKLVAGIYESGKTNKRVYL
ncbi:Gfo/Idh/MocA family protein [Paenibacillus marinisediminis]